MGAFKRGDGGFWTPDRTRNHGYLSGFQPGENLQAETSPSPHEAETPHANQKSPAVRLFTPAIVTSLLASK